MPSRAGHAAVLNSYVDGLGETRTPPRAVMRLLTEAVEKPRGPEESSVVVAAAGIRWFTIPFRRSLGRVTAGRLRLEEGGELPFTIAQGRKRDGARVKLKDPLPLGVHELLIESRLGASRIHVLSRPTNLARIVVRGGRRMAVFLPLYAASPGSPFGIGSYTDLRDLCEWSERIAGAMVGTLPLFPAFLNRPFDPSPYAPVSRLMWNELFVDPCEAFEWRLPAVQRIATGGPRARTNGRLASGPMVDYQASWKYARRVLGAMASAARRSPRRWSEVLSRASAETLRYARFRAAVDATGTGWHAWPAAWRAGRIREDRLRPADVDSYIYAQSLASEQLLGLKRPGHGHAPLYLDLPVGVHAQGFDTFTRPDLFLRGFSAGAPPDALNSQGQVWGFPPMHPWAGRADGYAHLRSVLRGMLSVAGVLRIDHIMGLYRMFCVPEGHDGTEGAYLRYPEEELMAIVLIEAARAGAMVVGEDLGTVPPEVRRLMRENGILGMHVQQFAFGGTRKWFIQNAGSHTLASLNTHDTPTFAGFWSADDVHLRHSLRQVDETGAARERTERDAARKAIAAALKERGLSARTARDAALSLMRLQARGPAPMTLVNLEDLWGERRPQNVPGTSTEYPNWRRRAAKPLPRIMNDPANAHALAKLNRERRRGGRK